MKKKAIWEFLSLKISNTNILLTMKITAVLMLSLTLQVSASVYSQDAKLKLVSKHNTMSDIIDAIESQTEYKIFYKTGQFDTNLSVSLTSTDQTVASLLYEVFDGSTYSYKLLDKIIVIAPTEAIQQHTVSGIVTDATTGEPLPGVNIFVDGTTLGVISNIDGKYSITIDNPNATLVFSFVGYITEKVAAQGISSIDIKLIPDVKKLEEVVVIGYGTVKRSDLTGSVSSVSSKTLDEVPVTNLGQALQGRAPGIEISRNSSRPGETPQIRIRGNRSLSGDNAPLTVVDGIPFSGNINDINPDDIVSVDILKDASSTAIYGARGSNGVIMVTTKRGRSGKTEVTLNSYYGITDKIGKYDVMNGPEYYALKNYTLYGGGIQPDEQAAMDAGKFTDWQDLIYKKGYSTNTELGVSGGSETTQFSLGSGFFKETAIMPGQSFERYSLRATVDHKIGKSIKVGMNTVNTLSYVNGESAAVIYNLLALSPLTQAYNEDGSVKIKPNSREDEYNPLLLEDENNWKEQRKRIRSFNSLYAEVEILKGLKYRVNAGLSLLNENYGFYWGANTPIRNGAQSQTGVRNINGLNYTVENLVTYDKTIAEKHKVSFTGLYSFEKSTGYRNAFAANNVSASYMQYFNLTAADDLTAVNYQQNFQQTWDNLLTREETTGLMSYMGRLNYGYDSRYLLTVSYRADGASVLAEGKKWHYYPAVAVAWNISNESFLENIGTISNLKLRAGYGQTSNAGINPYTTLGSMAQYPYNFGTSNTYGYYANTLANPNLSWEYTTTVNLGLDFGLLKGRISGSVDIYQAKTNDILVNKALPQTLGVPGGYITNAAKTQNKGIEVSLSAGIIESAKGFNWSIDGNFYINREKIVELEDPTTERNIANGWHKGYPLNVIYDNEKVGIWQLGEEAEAIRFQGNGTTPGTIKLADVDGNGTFNQNLDRKVLGTFEPDWTGGLTNRFSFKGFDLSVVTFAKMGQKVVATYYQDISYLNRLDGRKNGMHVDYWTETNPTNAFPKPKANDDRPDYGSTLGYFDGSFIKIRSINLGYTLPKQLLSKAGITSVRVYFTAQNPFILYSPLVKDGYGIDPEPSGQANNQTFDRANGNVSNGALILQANTPSTRQFIFGINLKF